MTLQFEPAKMTQIELEKRQNEWHLCLSCRHSDACRVPSVLGHLVDHWKLALASCALYDVGRRLDIRLTKAFEEIDGLKEAHEKTNEILRQATGNKFSSSGDHDLHCRCNAGLTELIDQHERAFAEIERLRAALQNIANSAYTDNTFVKIARNALGLESK